MTLKTYAMVAAPTAVTIAPKYNKALDKKAMVAAHAAVTMAPKNKNKLPSQQNFRKGTKPGVVSNNLRKKDNNTHTITVTSTMGPPLPQS